MMLFGYFSAAVVFFCVIALSLLPSTWIHRAGFVSYRVIELPFLRLKRYFSYSDEQSSHHIHINQVTLARAESSH
jgi:hypothetical protein